MSDILHETLLLLKTRYGERFKTATIERVNVGVFMTIVKLSTGYSGISVTDVGLSGCRSRFYNRNSGPFTPGNVKGQSVFDLFELENPNEVIGVVKLAVMNALSAEIIASSEYKIVEDADPVDIIDFDDYKSVCLVGAFRSYIRKFSASGHHLSVLELNENAFAEEHKKFYVPVENAPAILKNSDLIIITGSTLANNTLDDLLKMTPTGKAKVIVVGPTASLLPDVLFNRKVDIIGATRITDVDTAFNIISEGSSGYHLFGKCAKKICILN